MTRLLRFRFTFLAASYRTISGWLVLLIGLGGLSFPSWAQCPTGPVSLRTQADVKAFPPACSALPNSLTIWGDDIIDLSPLTNLQTIGGDLEIYANQKLVGLKGLEKLRAISGELRIAFNPQLSSLSGLSQLTSLSLGLDISQNPQLGSLAGLEKLTTLSGGLNIDYNDQLSSIRSLSQASISGFVNISYNPQLESLTGLEKLTALPEGIYIESNEQLTDISALSQVTSISGELRITNNPQLGQCAIQAICQYLAITPDLTGIYNNAPGCNSIEEIQQHCPAAPWVLGFSLIDADSDQPLQVLKPGEVINLAGLPTRNLAVRANTSGASIGSVKLELSGKQSRRVIENQAPYSLFGDTDGDYRAWTPAVGSYTLEATPYAGADGQGPAGTTFTLAFNVVDQPLVVSYSLINADTEQPIRLLTTGDELNLATLPVHLNIRANTSPAHVGSVKLELSGKQSRQQIETGAPYSLFGDRHGAYNAWTPAVGAYTLTGTPYLGASATGQQGQPLTISFRVVNQASHAKVGLEANAEEGAVMVYPNPFRESFQVRSPGNQPVVLYDLTGRKVFELETVQQEQVIKPGEGLAPGMYLLEVGGSPHVQRRKLLKVN